MVEISETNSVLNGESISLMFDRMLLGVFHLRFTEHGTEMDL